MQDISPEMRQRQKPVAALIVAISTGLAAFFIMLAKAIKGRKA
ncbi:hypothetical protein [Kozakia baliensis]|nr:hypothetical protein [Kozakia baliensis]GBR23126.1 hypothetical protein AA0488_0056 [Kozakia baliensis NRIC 0488]GEL65123.1 hypothetical protein KBA01_24090 [Kozakia baliensis]